MNAVLSLGVENTRTRDFYDLAEIRKRYWCEIDKEGLRKACLATMKQRGTSGLLKNWRDAIDRVAHSAIQKQYWQRYAEANSFAKEYDFDKCMQSIYDLAEASFSINAVRSYSEDDEGEPLEKTPSVALRNAVELLNQEAKGVKAVSIDGSKTPPKRRA